MHLIFGWLQVEEVLHVGEDTADWLRTRPWLARHPHLDGDDWGASNTVYVGAERLVVNGRTTGLRGGGMLDRASPETTLTAPDAATRSEWRLPGWFRKPAGGGGLRYHLDPKRWKADGPDARLKTVGRGQEFVIDVGDGDQAAGWLEQVLQPSGNEKA